MPDVGRSRGPTEPRGRSRSGRPTVTPRLAPSSQSTIDSVQVLSCAAATAFAAALLAGQFVCEARLHLPPGASEPLTLGFLAGGGAIGLWLPRHIARRGSGRPARPSSELAGVVFAAAALLAGLVAGPAGWTAARLERWRELIVTAFVLPSPIALTAVLAPLAICGVLAGATAAVVLAALHGWHRTAHRQRLHIAPLWIAWCGAVAAGSLIAFALRDPNRYWYVPALLLFLAAGIAVLRRGEDSPEAPAGGTTPNAQTTLEPVGIAAALGATLAAVFAAPSAAAGPIDLTVAIAIGGLIGVVMLRLCVRLAIGAEFSPLAAVLAAFLLLQPRLGMFVPISAAALATTGLALLGRQAAREARSIQHSLATVGAVSAAAFSVAAFVLAFFTGAVDARAGVLIVSVPVCIALGLLLVIDRRRSRAARIAGLACLALWCITAISGSRETPDRSQFTVLAAQPVRAVIVSDSETLVLGRAAEARDVDLASPPAATIVIAGSASEAPGLERRLVDRIMRRLGRRLMPGGRLVLEQPLDPGVETVIERYVRKTNPAFGSARELIVSRRGDGIDDGYRAVVIGPDVPSWIGGRAWPADYDASLCPLTPADVQDVTPGSGR